MKLFKKLFDSFMKQHVFCCVFFPVFSASACLSILYLPHFILLVICVHIWLSGFLSVLDAYTRTISQLSLAHHSAEREIILG